MKVIPLSQQPPVERRFTPRARHSARRQGVLRVALIEPRYEPSYYGMDYMRPLLPRPVRASYAGGALPLLAACVPAPHEVVLFNENVEPLDPQALTGFDVIGVTGMIVQSTRMKAILHALRDHPGVLVIGGPYVSVDETFFDRLADVVFIGEADESWPAFLDAVARGEDWASRHQQPQRTDMSRLPLPRYDLVDARHFLSASVQFSRGCPFLCEFCDIITIFGRQPRAKTPAQVIAEFEALRARGFDTVFLVDDNFIGNKKLARELLVELARWQRDNGYPLKVGTEASINLADEPELLSLMHEANFRTVFVGLETPNEESLDETRKVQNLRGDSMAARIQRIRDAGLIVEGGFMVGFDNDGPDIFERQERFIQETAIARAAISILTAIPSTPLYARLEAEGRLRLDDPNCNFEPARMTSAELRAGYLELTRRAYEPQAYFARVFGAWNGSPGLRQRVAERAARQPAGGIGAWAGLAAAARLAGRLLAALARDGEWRIARDYVRIWRHQRRHGEAGIGLASFIGYAAVHWHSYRFYRLAREGVLGTVNTYAYGRDDGPPPRPVVPPAEPPRKAA